MMGQRITAAAVMLVLGATSAHAVTTCSVKNDKKTGVFTVSASGVSGTLLWGSSQGAETESFFNAATCVASGKASKCTVADPTTLAARTPPAGCTIYLADNAGSCSAWVPSCVPGSRPNTATPVCGDGQATGSEACDGSDLLNQTCQSAGFLHGTLACTACALDTSGCTNDRFQDNGNGTVTDNQTGLMWEKKTGTFGGQSICPGGPTCADPHDFNNVYVWTTGAPWGPDGPAFFRFLSQLNGPSPFAGYDDWRLPTVSELLSIVDPAASGCSFGSACIDPVFGPTKADQYWTQTTHPDLNAWAWIVFFYNGSVSFNGKTSFAPIRAVRKAR